VEPVRYDPAVTVALVLSGGGARGAWAAGVLHGFLRRLSARDRAAVRFDVVAGTSAGAINGAFLAASAHDLAAAAEQLVALWARIRIGDVYRLGLRQLLRVPRSIWSDRGAHPWGEVALADASPLRGLLRDAIRWDGIAESLRNGSLSAFVVTATELATNRTVFFADGPAASNPLYADRNPRFSARSARIGWEHVLASAAIPLFFPPQKVSGRYYLDGGLGLNTPLRPALRLGADRVLVLSLRKHRSGQRADDLGAQFGAAPPSWAQVVGRTMSAVLLDRSADEVREIERINRVLRAADREGFDAAARISAAVHAERGAPWRVVEPMLVAPSEDLGAIAASVSSDARFGDGADEVTKQALRWLLSAGPAGENDALSYLLFDPIFVHALLEIGEADAERHRDALASFLLPG
jgi:NTE family protein